MSSQRVAYASCMALALVVAIVLRRPSSLTWRKRLATWAGAIAGAGLGAKLPFVLSGEVWLGDGKTILSGMAGGYLGVEIAKALAGIREKTGDLFAVPLAVAVGVGRWGCWFNGCCGAPHPTVLESTFRPAMLLTPPVFESAFHFAMAVVLWRLERVQALRWHLLKVYFIAYGFFRFGMEFIRSEPRVLAGLTPYHLGSLALILVMGVLWGVDERAKNRQLT